jgi:cytochrome c
MKFPATTLLLGSILWMHNATATTDGSKALEIAKKNTCLACHSVDHKVVGPAYKDVAIKYKGDKKAADILFNKVKKGGTGVWGTAVMPANSIPDADLKDVIQWILAGASIK